MAVRVRALMDRGAHQSDREGLLRRLTQETVTHLELLRWADQSLAATSLEWRWWWHSEDENYEGDLAAYLRRDLVWAVAPQPSGLSIELSRTMSSFSAGFLWDRFVSDGQSRDAFRVLARSVARLLGASTVIYGADEQWAPIERAHQSFLEGLRFDQIMTRLIADTMSYGSFSDEPVFVQQYESGWRRRSPEARAPGRSWAWYVDRIQL